MSSSSIKSQLQTIERQIGDMQQKLQFEQQRIQKEQTRLNIDIQSAQHSMAGYEPSSPEYVSWDNQTVKLQSQLQAESLTMQTTQDRHNSELSALQQQRDSLMSQLSAAQQREQLIRAAHILS